jgi:hypothetical protein
MKQRYWSENISVDNTEDLQTLALKLQHEMNLPVVDL